MMDLLTFLETVLPDEGIYCVARKTNKGAWHNYAIADLTSLADTINRVSNDQQDVWFGLGNYIKATQWDARYECNRFRRIKDNVKSLKALWLDIDVAKNKPDTYPDQATALAALDDFIKTTGLTKPFVVSSGYGLHVYFVLDKAIDPTQWLYLAERLRAICLGKSFLVDHSKTTDSISAPRPINTYNHKNGLTKEVRLLQVGTPTTVGEMTALLEELVQPYRDYLKPKTHVQTPTLLTPEDVDDPVLKAMLNVPAEILEEEKRVVGPIVRECQQVREAGLQSEPVWHRMIGLVKLCKNREKAIHQLSQIDTQRYDVHATEEKIRNTVATATTCTEFNRLRPGVCEHCPHWQAITSPIQLGVRQTKVDVQTIPIVPLPDVSEDTSTQALITQGTVFDKPNQATTKVVQLESGKWEDIGYEVNPDSGCWHIKFDGETTKRMLITSSVIRPVIESYDKQGSLCARWVITRPTGDVYVDVPLTDYHNPAKLLEQFGQKGCFLTDKVSAKTFSDFIRAYHSNLFKNGGLLRMKNYDHLGWGAENEFILGDRVVYPDGMIIDLPDYTFDGWETRCTQKGNLNAWSYAANRMFAGPQNALAAVMFLHGFASPLMQYFPGTECTLTYVVGASGVGKSTIASLMNSIWFSPAAFAKGAGDHRSRAGATMNSLFRTASVLHSLPLYIDEATLWDSSDVPSYIYDISSGEEKARLTSAITQRKTGSWRCTAMATANQSLRDKLLSALMDSSQHLYRIIEFRLPRQPHSDTARKDITTMTENYGWAGLQYARYLTKNAQSGQLQRALEHNRESLEKTLNFTQPERYWLAWATCIMTSLAIANEANLIKLDPTVIFGAVRAIINEQRQSITLNGVSRSDWFGELLEDLWPNTVVVANTGATHSNGSPVKMALRVPMQRLMAHVNTSTGVINISNRAIRDWCTRRKIGYADFIASLKELAFEDKSFKFNGKCKFSLGSGVTETEVGSNYVHCIRVTKPVDEVKDIVTEHETTKEYMENLA